VFIIAVIFWIQQYNSIDNVSMKLYVIINCLITNLIFELLSADHHKPAVHSSHSGSKDSMSRGVTAGLSYIGTTTYLFGATSTPPKLILTPWNVAIVSDKLNLYLRVKLSGECMVHNCIHTNHKLLTKMYFEC